MRGNGRRPSILWRRLAALLVLAGAAAVVRAELLPIKTYTSADGLIYEQVSRIYQDSRGFIWILTPVGASRFDGYRFTNYGIEDGLSDNLLTDIVEDDRGIYWLGTQKGVVYRFDPRAARGGKLFEAFRATEKPVPVNRLFKTKSGTVYVATDEGLLTIDDDRADDKFRRVAVESDPADLKYTGIAEDAAGGLWIGSQNGLRRLLPDGRTIRYAVEPRGASDLVRSLAVDAGNRVWLVTDDRRLIVFNPGPVVPENGNAPLRFDSPSAPAPGFAHRFTAAETPADGRFGTVRAGRDGKIWASAYKKGLVEYDGREFRLYTTANGLGNDTVGALAEDRFGNLWIGSDWGAMRLSRRGFISYNTADGLGDERILQLFEDRQGTVYATNEGWIVNRFDGRRFSSFKPDIPETPENWLSHKVLLDSAGDWWFATRKGLYRYAAVPDLARLDGRRPTKRYTTADGLPSDNIFGVFEDSGGDVWISFGDEDRADNLVRWERKTGAFRVFDHTDGIAGNCFARHFREDSAGNLYFGCGSENLVVYRGGRFFSYHSDNLPPGWWISDVFVDSRDRVWVGAPVRGLVRLDNLADGAPAERLYTTADGLSSIHVQFITEDRAGRICFVTSRGMDVLEPETGKVRQYTLADGLAAAGTGVALRDRRDDLWIGVSRGISRFTPGPDIAPVAPPVYIGSVLAAGREQTVSALGETDVPEIVLEPDQRSVRIGFYGLNLTSGEALRYQYKLEGTGEDWSAPTAQRSVDLNLAPGGYRFLVRAVTLEGTASDAPAAVSFRILRPVWQRWWFLLLVALAAGGTIYAIYAYRLRRLVEIERVRTRIASDLHDDIGASLSKIAILSEVVRHRVEAVADVRQPLEDIAATSRELVDSMSDIVWAINPERDFLGDLAQRMRNLAGELTEPAGIALRWRADGLEAHGKWALGADFRREVYLIFKETVNNLVKHSAARAAEIAFGVADGFLTVTVADDGRGFEPESVAADDATRGGNGLPNMRRRAGALGGTYTIDSKPGAGTAVVLRVPLPAGRYLLR
ncbi:MAG: hypothetical protein JSS81_07710 [Acidobacteria bacterium]|nr:hypothetical protein [Acidobacteriota bacterium]